MKRKFWLSLAVAALGVAAAGLSSCNNSQKPAAKAPEAAKPKPEGDLAYLSIPESSRKSLLIKSEKVRNQELNEEAEFTGWIAIPQGHEVTLTAPQAGYVRKAKGSKQGPVAGKAVALNQELFRLEPVLTPVEELQMGALQRDVAGELIKAQISLKAAQKELNRVEDLHKQGLRGQQEVEKAQERVDQARESVNAAKDKQKLFVEKVPIPIQAPLAGTVLTVAANPGEFVAKAAPLVTIADLGTLWVRMPVPEYEVSAVKTDEPVKVALKGVQGLGMKNAHAPDRVFDAVPVAKVPRVDLEKHTVDLIYELVPHAVQPAKGKGGPEQPPADAGGKMPFVKDQMVSVRLPLGKKKMETVVPYAAVVFDNQGGAWIYLDRGEKKVGKHEVNLFERRPVQLGPAVSDGLVIRPPLGAGAVVVTEGAAKLFSSEFHSAPGTPQEAIDDDD